MCGSKVSRFSSGSVPKPFRKDEVVKPNIPVKLAACGSRTHGQHRRCSHAAPYPQRSEDMRQRNERRQGTQWEVT